jgi:hypothetical protein
LRSVWAGDDWSERENERKENFENGSVVIVVVVNQDNAVAAASHDPFMFCGIIPYNISSIIDATYKQRKQNYQQRLFASYAPPYHSRRRTTS